MRCGRHDVLNETGCIDYNSGGGGDEWFPSVEVGAKKFVKEQSRNDVDGIYNCAYIYENGSSCNRAGRTVRPGGLNGTLYARVAERGMNVSLSTVVMLVPPLCLFYFFLSLRLILVLALLLSLLL